MFMVKLEIIENLHMLFPTQYDVGVDNNNFTPVSYAQVREIILKQVEDSKKMLMPRFNPPRQHSIFNSN